MIKVIKLFNKLIKLEPRLIKKLIEPYHKLLSINNAKSVEYELLSTIIQNFAENKQLYNNACEHLKTFVNNSDPNCIFFLIFVNSQFQILINSSLIQIIIEKIISIYI